MSESSRDRAKRPSRNRRAPDSQSLYPEPSEGIGEVHLRAMVRHPLIYRKRIAKSSRDLQPGDWVAVYAPAGENAVQTPTLIGYGIYNPRSEIAVRMLRWGDRLPDESYWDSLLSSAVNLRRDLLGLDKMTDAYRLIHAEGDGVPGLIVDRYANVLSAEVFSWGIWQRSLPIMDRLRRLTGTEHYVIRTAPRLVSQEGFDAPLVQSDDCPKRVTIGEAGTRFRIALDEATHKTGFFCDQRENRLRFAAMSTGQSVLDLCCYSGGFAVQSKKLGQAGDVIGVDLDEGPLTVARETRISTRSRSGLCKRTCFPSCAT